MMALGHFIAYVMAILSADSPIIYLGFCVPAIAVLTQAILLSIIYDFETPSFLFFKNKRSEVNSIQAKRVINRLYLINQTTPGSSISSEDDQDICAIISSRDIMNFSSVRKSLINSIILGIFSNLVGINTFLVYFPIYAKDMPGFTRKSQGLAIYASYFFLSFFIFYLIRSNIYLEIGRVNLIKIGSICMGICMVLMLLGSFFFRSLELYFTLVIVYLFFYQNSIGPI